MFKFDIRERRTCDILFTANLDREYGSVAKNKRAAVLWALRSCQALSGANLIGADLSGINFAGECFEGASLANADLTDANFFGANLCNVNIDGAKLTGASFVGALLFGTDLTNVDLTGVDLRRANTGDAKLNGPRLAGKNPGRSPSKSIVIEPKKDPAHDGLSRLARIEELYVRIIDQLDAMLTECKKEKNDD